MSFKYTEIGIIPQSWKLMSLGEVAEVIDPHPSHRAPAAVKTGLPFAGIGDIDEYGNINSEKARIVSEDVIEEHLKNYKVDNNSIGYGRVGTVGKVVKLKERSTLKYALSPTLAVINSNELIDKKFLYALLRSNLFFNQVKKYMTGSTRPSIGIKVLRDIKIPYPDINEQQYIGRIVSSLDEKIEVNNQINKTLENMAQAIFKQWFVDFEFPNQDGEPYRSSGGEMVESELGMIPKGWEVGTIGNYVKVKSGYAFKSTWWDSKGIAVIKIKDINNGTLNLTDCSFVSEKNASSAQEFIINGGEILIAMTGATIGKFAIVPKMNHHALVNQRVGKFFLGENPFDKVSFLYCILNQSSVYEEIVSRGDGSAQPNISPSGIESIKIVIPNSFILDKFNRLMKFNFQKITENIYENNKLVDLRDTLLPKLMSGEIRVPLDEEGDAS